MGKMTDDQADEFAWIYKCLEPDGRAAIMAYAEHLMEASESGEPPLEAAEFLTRYDALREESAKAIGQMIHGAPAGE